MSSEVTDLITALRQGSMSLEEVAARFRSRTWPRHRKGPTSTYLELATAAQQDPEPYIPGSFDDVTAAYNRGELSDDEYEVLAHAMAEAKVAADIGEVSRESGEEGSGLG
jgi:hypothetical protein